MRKNKADRWSSIGVELEFWDDGFEIVSVRTQAVQPNDRAFRLPPGFEFNDGK
jgi:hypothetical protein